MILNIGDKKTKLLLSLAKTPLPFYPHYKYHLRRARGGADGSGRVRREANSAISQ